MKINRLREKIDSIDNEIIKLLNKRIEFSNKIGKLKLKNNHSIYNPIREKEIINKLYFKQYKNLNLKEIKSIYEEIFAINRSKQMAQKVAYLNDKRNISYKIIIKKFGKLSNYRLIDNVKNILEMIDNGDLDYGIINISNKKIKKDFFNYILNYDISIILEIIEYKNIFFILTKTSNEKINKKLDMKTACIVENKVQIINKSIIKTESIKIDSKKLIYIEYKGIISIDKIVNNSVKFLGYFFTENIMEDI